MEKGEKRKAEKRKEKNNQKEDRCPFQHKEELRNRLVTAGSEKEDDGKPFRLRMISFISNTPWKCQLKLQKYAFKKGDNMVLLTKKEKGEVKAKVKAKVKGKRKSNF